MADPCIGCGFEIDAITGELGIKGARVVRQDGVTPLEWPYDGSISDEFPAADITLTNGLGCDQATGDLFAFPNSTARAVRGVSTLIAATPLPNAVFSWGIGEADFPGPNPWNDSGSHFGLSTFLELALTNPSGARPMLAEYAIQLGPTTGIMDSGVGLNTSFVGNIWDDPNPYPGDAALGFNVGMAGTNDPSPGLLDNNGNDGFNLRFVRPTGPGAVLSTYLAPLATTRFRVAWRGQMTAGSATFRVGQSFAVAGGFNTFIIARSV